MANGEQQKHCICAPEKLISAVGPRERWPCGELMCLACSGPQQAMTLWQEGQQAGASVGVCSAFSHKHYLNILHEWTHTHPVLQCHLNLLAMCDKGLSMG